MWSNHAATPVEANGVSMSGAQTVLLCRAPHPRGLRGDSRFEGRLCGKRLQVVPFAVRPTYRTIRDWSEVNPGCMAVRCLARDCRAFTEYEIVQEPPQEERPVAAPEFLAGM
jgi:hypothetical protein